MNKGTAKHCSGPPIATDSNAASMHLLELWLNEVLDGSSELASRNRVRTVTHRGLEAHQLCRRQLQAQKLSSEQISQIYRTLFVHAVSFGDVLADALEHEAQRDEVLPSVWTAFVKLCEETTKRTFQTHYGELMQRERTQRWKLEGLEKRIESMASLFEESKKALEMAREELQLERQEHKRLQARTETLERELQLKSAELEDVLGRFADSVEQRMKAEEETRCLKSLNEQLKEKESTRLQEIERTEHTSRKRQEALNQIRDAVLPVQKALMLLDGEERILIQSEIDTVMMVQQTLRRVRVLYDELRDKEEEMERLKRQLSKARDRWRLKENAAGQ